MNGFLWAVVLLNLGTMCISLARLHVFAERYPTLSTREDLDRYRSLIAAHMWAVLVSMATVFLIPPAMMMPLLLHREYVGVDWWPVLLMSSVLLFRSQVGRIEARCRNLQVSQAFAGEYEGINATWTSKALPRFPSPAPSDTSMSSGDAVHDELIRKDGYDDDVTMHRNSIVMSALGISDSTFGALGLMDTELPELHAFALILLVLGVVTFVGGVLLSWRIELGYKISITCAALHLPLLPVGTALGSWMLISMRTAARALSRGYLDALRRAKVAVVLPTARYIILGTLVVLVHGGALFGWAIMIIILSGTLR